MNTKVASMKPTLVIAGTGIQGLSQITKEVEHFLDSTDRVFYLANNPLVTKYILEKRPEAVSLFSLYEVGLNRRITYDKMTRALVSPLQEGFNSFGLFYGHPGVFVNPTHRAIKVARNMGFAAYMLPAVSAEDCLFADLLVDPGVMGCQSYEATDFLLHNRIIDRAAPLILWQVGVLGHKDYQLQFEQRYIAVLQERLIDIFDANHYVTSYVAASFPHLLPDIDTFPLCALGQSNLSPVSTLYIPPFLKPEIDQEIARKLNW
jgi:uncharacterized protein YabN with tetrapyrrole methylase and pyrophosphatase domain